MDPSLGPALSAHFERELEPHFRVEESVLLPALRLFGGDALALRVEREHAAVRAFVEASAGGDRRAAAMFAALLREHVRFEERELFPWCEARLPADVLAAVDRAGSGDDVTATPVASSSPKHDHAAPPAGAGLACQAHALRQPSSSVANPRADASGLPLAERLRHADRACHVVRPR